MIYQVLADRVVPIHGKSDFKLRPNTIHAGNKHWLLVTARIQREQAPEAAYLSKHLPAMCRSQQLRQRGLDLVSKINIHTSSGIRFHQRTAALQSRSRLKPRTRLKI